MRGSRLADAAHEGLAGIIPAHAGLTMLLTVFKDDKGDHPRACGAHLHLLTADTTAPGSSPRMRGSRKE